MFKFGIRNRLIASFLILIIVTIAALATYILMFFHEYNLERLTANLYTESEITEQLLRPYMAGPTQKAAIDDILKEFGFVIILQHAVL